MTDILFRGFSSFHPEKVTDSGRVVLRRGEPDACVPRELYGDVTSGTADHGQRSQEEIWTLIIHMDFARLLSSTSVRLS